MVRTISVLSALLLHVQPPAAPPQDFSRSYVIWISVDEGRCVFWLTDAGENASEVTESLSSSGYNKALRIELLTERSTPQRCVRRGRMAVSTAGFTKIRVRRGTERDRSPGIP